MVGPEQNMAPELLSLWPFGSGSMDVWHHAYELLDDLSVKTSTRTPQGLQRLNGGLVTLVNLERAVTLMAVHDTSELERRQGFHQALGKLHAALPFSEAERGWFCATYKADLEDTSVRVEFAPYLERDEREAVIVSAGVRRVVKGRELGQRWAIWRRQSGEYEDQGGLLMARNALRDIVVLTNPASEQWLPKAYSGGRRKRPASSAPEGHSE